MKAAEDQSHYTATSLPPGHKGSEGSRGSKGSRGSDIFRVEKRHEVKGAEAQSHYAARLTATRA